LNVPVEFLANISSRGIWPIPSGFKTELIPIDYWLGNGDYPLEVVVASTTSRPATPHVRELWKAYQGNRPAPVLLVIIYRSGDQQVASACGPIGQNPAVWDGLPLGQLERLAKAALEVFDRNQASRLIQQALPELQTALPGVSNRGLFSTHDLINGVPQHSNWNSAVQLSLPLLERKGDDLIAGLGFDIESLTPSASVLRDSGTRKAIAVFLEDHELPEVSNDRFNLQSPVTYALSMADQEGLPYAIVTRGAQIRLYCADVGRGVGRKGRTESYIELNLSLIAEENVGLLNLLFAPSALEQGGTVDQLLDDSHRFAMGIGERLRERIYIDAVPALATSLARKQSSDVTPRTPEKMDLYYQQAMLVLFRILFVAYAEDRDLLPYRTNGEYKDHSLQRHAERLVDHQLNTDSDQNEFAPNQSNLWDEINALWKAVAKGNSEWGVPPYNGGLFDDDPAIRPAGAALAKMSLANSEFGPALLAMLVDETEEGVFGPVDFRSLSVREFGTIYEGLLESSLGFAETDLTVDKKGSFIPASAQQEIVVKAGEYYLHNRSGARKSSGAYFTKPFAVEHLLDYALIPALEDHLQRIKVVLASGDEVSAAEMFFDFRCADISMGSGHFLIAAIDRIEREMANFLNAYPVPGVQQELEQLRNSAISNLGVSLGGSAQSVEIENSSLLRRQIARRCIYGVDLNPISVELARLSVWIHTFVPGLPLSLLDRTLIHGDSLTGIGTVEELFDVFEMDPGEMFATHVRQSLESATEPLKRLARISEANILEVGKIREEYNSAVIEAESVSDVMDLAVGVRLGEADKPAWIDLDQIDEAVGLDQAKSLVREINALHFPASFPEVFVSDRPGFDCIIGNPPWEKIKVEEHEFWGRHFPGHRSRSQAEQRKNVEVYRNSRPELVLALENEQSIAERQRIIHKSGPFDLGVGDSDLFKSFSWKFWQLVADGGYIGVVLPRSALAALGMSSWRKAVTSGGSFEDTTLLQNRSYWVFDDMESRYTISLTTIKKSSESDNSVSTRGPFASFDDYSQGVSKPSAKFSVRQITEWNEDLTIPLIPSSAAGEVYKKMMSHPDFSSNKHHWSARPVNELHATNDKHLMTLEPETGDDLWPVYGGSSFNLWNSDTGERYAWIDSDKVRNHLHKKRGKQARTKSSAFYGISEAQLNDSSTLDIYQPRIVFRDVTNRTNSRTLLVALAPPRVTLNHKAPYLLFAEGAQYEPCLLGLMSSIPHDWMTRRIVETNITFNILNSLPVPIFSMSDRNVVELSELSARLAAVDERYGEWALRAGVGVNTVVTDSERQDIIHRIDALVAHLYGLDEVDLKVIFETFHVGWDYKPRLEAVLTHFRSL
jgi:hypothetical protein